MGEIVLKKYDAFPKCKGLSESLGLNKSDTLPARFIGYGPWKKRWYSICSVHRDGNIDCNLCKIGGYRNVWSGYLSSLFFKFTPKLWIIWANRNNKKFAGREYGNKSE